MRYTAIGPALAMLVVLAAPALSEDIAPESAISAKLAATLYYTALEADYPPGQSAPFLDIDGKVLRTASDAFLAAAAIEGTAEFTDGVVLNYAARVGGAVRWMEVERGLDARGCELVAFRSAAVDPALVKLGSVLHIEETVGMPLPDGSRHDGSWIAADTGPSIKGNRIDLYTGRGIASMEVIFDFGIVHLQELQVTLQDVNLPCKPKSRR